MWASSPTHRLPIEFRRARCPHRTGWWTHGFSPLGRAAQARSASRWIGAGTVRKHGTALHRLIRGGERSQSSPHHARARNPKPLVLAAFFGYFLSLVTESTPAGGIYRHKGCAGRNPPVTALPWPWGRELRIATGAARPRNDKGFCKECGCIIDGAVGGQPQGSPQRKIRVIFRDLLRGLIAGISPGWAVV